MPWHREEPNVVEHLRADLARKYPDLHLSLDGDVGYLRGTFPVIHDGVELDRFTVEIRIPEAFPREIPIVFEKAHRIPHDVDWHTFQSGNLCVIVPEEWFLNPHSDSLIAYLDGPLRNYFINHALAEAGQPRPMGARDHGAPGLFEAYGEIVGTTNHSAIVKYLDYCTAKKLKLHWKCPCGSGRRVSICHLGKVIELRKRVPRWIAEKALNRLKQALAPTSAPASSPVKA
jgi:hypothetical protein